MSETVATPDCCLEDANLEEQDSERDDLTIRVCAVCGRRHFEVVAEPGDLRAEAP